LHLFGVDVTGFDQSVAERRKIGDFDKSTSLRCEVTHKGPQMNSMILFYRLLANRAASRSVEKK
jgi:hypothetical protein